MSALPDRVPFLQAKEWDERRGIGQMGIATPYAEDRCCYCYRPVKPGATRLLLTRDDGGEWFVVVPPGRAPAVDEGVFGHFSLPIGPDCLRAHPEFLLGVVNTPA